MTALHMPKPNRFPNLFIPGAGKSGTSSLHLYLNQHPDIFMSDVKEPHYFSNDEYFSKQTEQYLSLFEDGKNAKYIGESSTGYMAFPNVIERITNLCEDPKFIFVLRNPIDRAYSHYNWLVGLGVEEKNFADAFKYDFNMMPVASENNLGLGYKYYYQWGRYAHWIRRYIQQFGRENILVITTESLARDPLFAVNRCFEFLGVEKLADIDVTKVNETVNVKHKKALHTFLSLDAYLRRQLFSEGLRACIPVPAKRIYRNACIGIRKLLMSNSVKAQTQQLDADGRDWVAGYYKEDVASLKVILGVEFSEWRDFSEASMRKGEC